MYTHKYELPYGERMFFSLIMFIVLSIFTSPLKDRGTENYLLPVFTWIFKM